MHLLPLPLDSVGEGMFWAVGTPCLSVRMFVCLFLSRQILLPRYVMNGLSSCNETYRKYLLSPTDDLIRFWRSKVTVIAEHRGGEGIQVNTGASKTIF